MIANCRYNTHSLLPNWIIWRSWVGRWSKYKYTFWHLILEHYLCVCVRARAHVPACVYVCVGARAHASVCMCMCVFFVGADGCLLLTMLADVCQCCHLLMFVCLPPSRHFPWCKTWWIKNLNPESEGETKLAGQFCNTYCSSVHT